VVECVVTFVVMGREDGRGVEEESGDEVEGSCTGFASEHELLVVLGRAYSSGKGRETYRI